MRSRVAETWGAASDAGRAEARALPFATDVSAAITDCERRIAAIRAEQATLVAELHRRLPGWFADGVREELMVACRITETQARSRSRTALALQGRLGLTRDALRAGHISWEHAVAMTDATQTLTAAQSTWVEQEVLDDPRAVTPGQLGFRARAAAYRVTDVAPERRVAVPPERSLDAFRHDTRVDFALSLPAPEAALVQTYVDAASVRQGPDDDRPASARRADALVDLVRSALDAGTLPSGGDGRRPHVEMVASLESLRAGAWLPAQVDGRPVVGRQLRELGCDADLRLSVLDGHTRTLVDQGRTTRVVSSALRGRLAIRDQHCRFPGCEVRARACRAHHIRHWADGGPTDLANLLLACERHHRAVHSGWSVHLDPDGTATWHSPGGQRVAQPGDLALLAEPDDLEDWEIGDWVRPWWELLLLDGPPPDAVPAAPAPQEMSDVPPF